MSLVAKIRFSSPLPQLDKEFDYLVPGEISDSLKVGQLVDVPFGSGGKSKTGVICSISEEPNPRANILGIASITSSLPVLSEQQLKLCEAVASRQAGVVGELLTTAIPKRFVRVEATYQADDAAAAFPETPLKRSHLSSLLDQHPKVFYKPELFSANEPAPIWALEFASAAAELASQGKSSLVVLPDFAELAKFERAIQVLGLSNHSFRHSSSDTGSQRYLNHLKALTQVGINYGLRSACFAPAKNLDSIFIWDDGDESHTEQGSPYWTSREVLLQRSELEGTKLVLASHSPSAEVIRLVDIGYLHLAKVEESKPTVIITDLDDRIDSQTFAAISNSLQAGEPVLIQIANLGWASSLVCTSCKELRRCPNCESSFWVDPSGMFRCRSCKTKLQMPACKCGKISTRPTRLGASAIAQQMTRAFPNATVVHSNGENRLTSIKGGSILVVSTPGAEPEVNGGYGVVVIADAARMVGSPRLRALEQSIAKWANATSLAKRDSTIIFVGLKDILATRIKDLDFYRAIEDDYQDRIELGLPPTTRLASVTSSNAVDAERLATLFISRVSADRVRILPTELANTLVIDYQYSFGIELALLLKELTHSLTQSSKAKKPGERVYRINMDDGKVI
jgi:primosomal protein N' (replication factor Y)